MSIRPLSRVEDGDGGIGAGDLVVEFLAGDALGRPAEAVTVEGDRSAEIGYGQGDEEDLRLPSISFRHRRSPGVLQREGADLAPTRQQAPDLVRLAATSRRSSLPGSTLPIPGCRHAAAMLMLITCVPISQVCVPAAPLSDQPHLASATGLRLRNGCRARHLRFRCSSWAALSVSS